MRQGFAIRPFDGSDEDYQAIVDVWNAAFLDEPDGMPESWFIVVDGGRYVGMSQLWRNLADPKLLQTGLTGVSRTHRRRGLATALKVRAIMGAKESGVETIRTDNEEKNPMYVLNVKLGFKPIPSWLSYKNELAKRD